MYYETEKNPFCSSSSVPGNEEEQLSEPSSPLPYSYSMSFPLKPVSTPKKSSFFFSLPFFGAILHARRGNETGIAYVFFNKHTHGLRRARAYEYFGKYLLSFSTNTKTWGNKDAAGLNCKLPFPREKDERMGGDVGRRRRRRSHFRHHHRGPFCFSLSGAATETKAVGEYQFAPFLPRRRRRRELLRCCSPLPLRSLGHRRRQRRRRPDKNKKGILSLICGVFFVSDLTLTGMSSEFRLTHIQRKAKVLS